MASRVELASAGNTRAFYENGTVKVNVGDASFSVDAPRSAAVAPGSVPKRLDFGSSPAKPCTATTTSRSYSPLSSPFASASRAPPPPPSSQLPNATPLSTNATAARSYRTASPFSAFDDDRFFAKPSFASSPTGSSSTSTTTAAAHLGSSNITTPHQTGAAASLSSFMARSLVDKDASTLSPYREVSRAELLLPFHSSAKPYNDHFISYAVAGLIKPDSPPPQALPVESPVMTSSRRKTFAEEESMRKEEEEGDDSENGSAAARMNLGRQFADLGLDDAAAPVDVIWSKRGEDFSFASSTEYSALSSEASSSRRPPPASRRTSSSASSTSKFGSQLANDAYEQRRRRGGGGGAHRATNRDEDDYYLDEGEDERSSSSAGGSRSRRRNDAEEEDDYASHHRASSSSNRYGAVDASPLRSNMRSRRGTNGSSTRRAAVTPLSSSKLRYEGARGGGSGSRWREFDVNGRGGDDDDDGEEEEARLRLLRRRQANYGDDYDDGEEDDTDGLRWSRRRRGGFPLGGGGGEDDEDLLSASRRRGNRREEEEDDEEGSLHFHRRRAAQGGYDDVDDDDDDDDAGLRYRRAQRGLNTFDLDRFKYTPKLRKPDGQGGGDFLLRARTSVSTTTTSATAARRKDDDQDDAYLLDLARHVMDRPLHTLDALAQAMAQRMTAMPSV